MVPLVRAEIPKLETAMTVEPRTFVTIQAIEGTGDIVQIQSTSGTYRSEERRVSARSNADDRHLKPNYGFGTPIEH